MKIGRRTQAYFVGFLIGVAIVSILIDSRRDRSAERESGNVHWVREPATVENLPASIRNRLSLNKYVTAVAEVGAGGDPTGRKGYFFADAEGTRYWWLVDAQGDGRLWSAEQLLVQSQPGLEFRLMKAGFEHQGHKVLSDPETAPEYRIALDVHSAMEWVDAVENLRSKQNYIALIQWVPAN